MWAKMGRRAHHQRRHNYRTAQVGRHMAGAYDIHKNMRITMKIRRATLNNHAPAPRTNKIPLAMIAPGLANTRQEQSMFYVLLSQMLTYHNDNTDPSRHAGQPKRPKTKSRTPTTCNATPGTINFGIDVQHDADKGWTYYKLPLKTVLPEPPHCLLRLASRRQALRSAIHHKRHHRVKLLAQVWLCLLERSALVRQHQHLE